MKLSTQFLILILFAVLFFAVGYQSVFYFQIQKNIVDSRVSEASSIIQLSGNEMMDSVYFLDYESINLQLNNLKKNPLISNVFVMYPDGRVISDGTESNEQFNMMTKNNFIKTSIGSDIIHVEIKQNMIQLVIPIIIVDKIGILYMDYSLSDINQLLMNSLFVLLIFTIFLSVIGIIVGLYISSTITKPIRNIQKISTELAKGNFDIDFDSKKSSIDEMNELLTSLQEMSINMKENQLDLLKSERFSAIGELSARIAHDIRNPLSVIQASLDLFEYVKDDPEKFDKLLERNSRAVGRITHQIDEVMDFIRQSKLHIEKIHLKEMFDSLVSEINDIDKIKINLPKNDLEISGDKGKLLALFSNLILNAVQAIGDDGIITISISQLNDAVQIDIEDNGKGVLEKDLEKIFEPLFTTKQEGTGLGLASCKKIVELHGGSISVKNNPTTFTVILPLVFNPVN